MLMVIDVGNSNMVFALYEGEKLVGSFRLATGNSHTSDEIGLTVCAYFTRFGLDIGQVTGAIIVSVVPNIMQSLASAIVKYFNCKPVVVNQHITAGLRYKDGQDHDLELGGDRSVACLAALEQYGGPLLVLDFGTATTIDALNREGVYIGGSICAGLGTSVDALYHSAAMLPNVQLEFPAQMLGFDTMTQIQAGAVGGYIGAIEYLIRRSKEELGEPSARVVATGGMARLMAENSSVIDVVSPMLIPDGLRLLYRRYREQQAQKTSPA